MFGGGLIAAALCSGGKSVEVKDDWQPWQRPLDWAEMPEPEENQIIFLTSSWSANVKGGYENNSVIINAFDTLPDDFSVVIDWGDGNTSTAVKKSGRLEWTNSNGFNMSAMYEGAPTETVNDYPINYYIYYDSDGNRHWNSGGTVLNDGTRVFIVTVTVSHPDLVYIGSSTNWGDFELYIGKKIQLDWINSFTIQHIKCFGWQPQNNLRSDLFRSAFALRKISATEPFTEIPDNDKFNPSGLFFEMDFSEVTKIGKKAFCRTISNDMGFGNPKVDLPKCTEIAEQTFEYNSYIKEINAPLLEILGDRAFAGCENLTKIDMPNAADAGRGCFDSCTKLQEINAPNLISIGNNGLQNCYNLESFVPNNELNLNNAGAYQSYLWQDNPKYPYAFDDVQ